MKYLLLIVVAAGIWYQPMFILPAMFVLFMMIVSGMFSPDKFLIHPENPVTDMKQEDGKTILTLLNGTIQVFNSTKVEIAGDIIKVY